MWRIMFYALSFVALLGAGIATAFDPHLLYLLLIVVALVALGIYDIASAHNVLSNYPIIGHIRYMLEFISPEIRQYFLETTRAAALQPATTR